MWSTFSLLLLLVGVSTSNFLGIHSSDDSDSVVKTFLAKMTKTIEAQDAGMISDLFADDFFFKGCRGDYDKNKVIKILSSLPSGTQFSTTFKSSKYLSSDEIEYFVVVTGFGPTLEAQFILSGGKLKGGSVPACAKPRFFDVARSRNNSRLMLERFIQRLEKSVGSKDPSIISALFAPDFVFDGCWRRHDKQGMIDLLLDGPNAMAHMELTSYHENGKNIQFTVRTTAFYRSYLTIDFVLNVHDQQLIGGRVEDACLETRFWRKSKLSRRNDAESIAKGFMNRIETAAKARDVTAISALLQDNFTMKSCTSSYNKTLIIKGLMEIPLFLKFSLKSAHDTISTITFTIDVSRDEGTPTKLEFVYNRHTDQLASGRLMNCASPLPHDNVAAPITMNDIDPVLAEFLNDLVDAIGSQNETAISDLFMDSFGFYGCQGFHKTAGIMKFLSHLPQHYNGTIDLIDYQDFEKAIQFRILVSGFSSPFDANLFYGKVEKKLLIGFSVCEDPTTPEEVEQKDPDQVIVEKFIARMVRSVESKDVSIISGLFQPGFVFVACGRAYGKDLIVERLLKQTNFSINYNGFELQRVEIKFSVFTNGFDNTALFATFFLSLKDQQLIRGYIPGCRVSQHSLIAQDNAQTMVEKFSARMVRSVESKDVSIISGLFQPGFVFKGCKGTYDKTKIIALLSQLPAGSKFGFTVKSVNDLGASIKYQVSASGIVESDIVIEFVLNKNDQQLESGNVPACQKHTFHSLMALHPTKDKAEKFLARMVKSIESRDKSAISELFQSGFVYKGCKGTYNKEQTISLLMDIPPGTKLFYAMKNVVENGVTLGCALVAHGLSKSSIELEFSLNLKDQQLENANVKSCPVSRRFADPESSDDVINRFLTTLRQTLATHDSSEIGKIFDDNFLFKGCHGTYTKAQALQMLGKMSSELSFQLKSSDWNTNGQIEYTVTVSGYRDDFDAQFVFCPFRNVLKSGMIPGCPARRRFY